MLARPLGYWILHRNFTNCQGIMAKYDLVYNCVYRIRMMIEDQLSEEEI